MQVHNDPRSAFVTVTFESADVAQFARAWPCFDGPECVSFTFQRSNGDLVDMEPTDWDGGAAVAMSEDAWAYFEAHPVSEPPEDFRGWLTATIDAEQIAELAAHGAGLRVAGADVHE